MILRVAAFGDKDSDAWDRDSKPDLAAVVTVSGTAHQVKEHSESHALRARVGVNLKPGAKVTVVVQDRDPKGKAETIGTGHGVFAGKPLLFRAGWAVVEVLTLEQALGRKFADFVKSAHAFHRKFRARESSTVCGSSRG